MPKQADETPPVITEARYLKLEDVATYLSVSVPQVYALVRSGELPAIKIGGRGVCGSTRPSWTRIWRTWRLGPRSGPRATPSTPAIATAQIVLSS